MNAGCAGNCEILENACHTWVPERCTRQGAIQIHVYLYLYLWPQACTLYW